MSQPHSPSADLLELAVPYALHALSDDERDRIEGRVVAAGSAVADAFYDEVRAVRETMAVVSRADATEPPADLRRRLLAAIADDNVRVLPSKPRRRTAWMSAAAALAIAVRCCVVSSARVIVAPPSMTLSAWAST